MRGVCVDAEERMAGYRTGGTSVLSWEEEAEKGWSERWGGDLERVGVAEVKEEGTPVGGLELLCSDAVE